MTNFYRHGGGRPMSAVAATIAMGLLLALAGVLTTRQPVLIVIDRSPMPTRLPSPTSAAPNTLVSSAEKSIAKREYEASANDRGLQAPNRVHNLRTYFEPWGARVTDRTAAGGPELFRMTTVGIGRVDRLRALGAGEIRTLGARVENRRDGGVVEWYENGEAGLEHGYILEQRPPGDGALAIHVRFEGASVSVTDGRAAIETATGRRLDYGKLIVTDATGRELAASMEAAIEGGVRVEVEDVAAEFPILIDPLLSSTPDTLLQSNQASSNWGYSVAGAGDVNGDGFADVVVGALTFDAGQLDEGAAFVFHGSPTGIASGGPESANTTLQSNIADSGLGFSVAGAGDVNGDGYSDVIIGAYNFSSGQNIEGSAYVFHGSPSGIPSGSIASAATTLEGNQALSRLGYSVAAAGDVNADGYADVIVGATYYDNGQLDEGAVFVFHGSSSGIPSGSPATADATIQSDREHAEMGRSVAGAGDVNADGYADVIVGVEEYAAPSTGEGVAFVFHGGPAGIADGTPGTANARLESNQSIAHLGNSVAGAGDVNGDGYSDVIVGAIGYNNSPVSGAAFVFHGGPLGIPNGNPSTSNAVLISDETNTEFGRSVAGVGDVNGDGFADVLIGAPHYEVGEVADGAAFVFHGSASGIPSGGPPTANATLPSDRGGAQLGTCVAGAGDVNGDGYADAIVAALYYSAGEELEGAAFVYVGGAEGVRSGTPSTATATLLSDQEDAQLGTTVAAAGDVNGDGYADVIVGAVFYDAGEHDEGAAFIFHGGAAGIASGTTLTANAMLQADQINANLGESIASAGDVNGDGFADVIVGSSSYIIGTQSVGAAFVFHGSPSGIASGNPSTANATLQSSQQGAQFGTDIAGAGDVNGDGYADVLVGALGYDADGPGSGAAFVFHGGLLGIGNGTPQTANATLISDQGNSHFGESVAGAGDVNGDGYADVMVAAKKYAAGQFEEGAAFVFHGSPTGVPSGSVLTADAVLQSDQELAQMGLRLSGAGDVNGDGYADVIIGARLYDNGQEDEGAAFVFHGSPSGIGNGNPGTANATLQSNQVGAGLGWSVADAGDVNGDGYADVIVGASTYTEAHFQGGAAFVFHGSSHGIVDGDPTTADTSLQSDQVSSFVGYFVAGAGDVDGDGFADVIVGAPAYDDGNDNVYGAAFVFHGNGDGLGRSVRTQQLRGDGSSTTVEPWGSSLDSDDFQVRMNATHPLGRGRVKIQVEASPAGENWGGANGVTVTSASWIDVTATSGGVVLVQTVGGLDPHTLYRWRARVLYAPLTFVNAPIAPSHGPWRRLRGQAREADIRTAVAAPPLFGTDTPGIYAASTGAWFLRNSNTPGAADLVFGYGPAGLGWLPLEGDWDGNGTDTAGLYDPVSGFFFLKNSNAPGAADLVYGFGPAGQGWMPIVGDWDGDGADTVGLYNPANGFFFLRNVHAPGAADLVYGFGPADLGWMPIVGDWDGDGADTVGLYNPANGFFFLRNVHAPGAADLVYGFGPAGIGWKPLAGDWNGDGADTIGLYSPTNGFFFMRNIHAPGAADVVFGYGPANTTPVLGDWNGL